MPLLVLLFLFWHGGEGHDPSPSCLCLIDASGRGIPLLVAFLLFRRDEKGYAPPRRVVPLSTWQGGVAPSPLCLCLIFNASGRGIPLLVAFLLFRRDEEGHPLLIVSFPFQHGEEGDAPSPLCHSHFNTARRDVPSSSCLHFTSGIIM